MITGPAVSLFTDRLCTQMEASANTIAGYRDTGGRRFRGERVVQWHLADLAWIDVKSTVRSSPGRVNQLTPRGKRSLGRRAFIILKSARIRSNGPAGGGACASLTAPGLHAPRDPDKLQLDAFGFGCVQTRSKSRPPGCTAGMLAWFVRNHRAVARTGSRTRKKRLALDKPALHPIRAVGADDDFDDDLAAVALASGKCQLDRCNDVFRVADQFACRDV